MLETTFASYTTWEGLSLPAHGEWSNPQSSYWCLTASLHVLEKADTEVILGVKEVHWKVMSMKVEVNQDWAGKAFKQLCRSDNLGQPNGELENKYLPIRTLASYFVFD